MITRIFRLVIVVGGIASAVFAGGASITGF
jgi:hypothetical protein